MALPPASSLAVLFITHTWCSSIAARYTRLSRELSGHADCFVLLHDDGGAIRDAWSAYLESVDAGPALRLFKPDDLEKQLGFSMLNPGSIMPGSAHFPLLAFSRHAQYRYYWIVESDVEYRGHWQELFSACRECAADLLAAHVYRHHQRPDWFWWISLRAPSGLPKDETPPLPNWYKAFLPVSRYSAKALSVIDAAHRQGWVGHYEVLVPTLLDHNGLVVQDINDITACYLGTDQDDVTGPRLSTMRWRPEITADEFTQRGAGPVLFHPVKQAWHYDGASIVSVAEAATKPL